MFLCSLCLVNICVGKARSQTKKAGSSPDSPGPEPLNPKTEGGLDVSLEPPSHFKHRNPLCSVPSLTAARPASCGNPFQEFTASIWFHSQGAGISGRLQGFSSNYSLPCFYSTGFRFQLLGSERQNISLFLQHLVGAQTREGFHPWVPQQV